MAAKFFELLEDAFITKLEPLTGQDIEVVFMPENAAGNQPAVTKPRVTVMYAKEAAKDNESTDRVQQESDVSVLIQVEAVKRRGDLGLYDVMDRVEKLLVGWYPPHCCKPVIVKEGGYDELKGQTWNYYQHYQTTRFVVEDTQEEDLPLLSQVSFYSNIEGSAPTFDGSFEGSS